MERESNSLEFWEQKPPTVFGMILNDDSEGLEQVERADILSQLPPLEGTNILELGSGIGRYTSHFAQVSNHVTAVDFIEKFVDQNRQANSLFNNISYHCSDVMALDFEPSSFDFIFMNWLLMYLDDEEIAILRDKVRGWLRSEGMVFFRESCFVGSSDHAYESDEIKSDEITRYRSDVQYMQLFEDGFTLRHRGNVKVYEQRFGNPHQHYWLYQRA